MTEPCCDYRDHGYEFDPIAQRIVASCACECHGTRCPSKTPFVLKLNEQDVTVAEVSDLPQRGLTSLTYNYQQRIQVRSVDDLDGRVLLHEVLHALLRTDPQRVCPADDDRHEDFVRMLTAGLHDAAGYRRCGRVGTRHEVERILALADELDAAAVAGGVDGPYSPDTQFAAGLQSAAERIRAALATENCDD